MRIPLFPLNVVLFPDGHLPLRVFEPRYLRMVGDCLQNDSPFGICLIQEGGEVGPAATPHAIGTLAHIVDWEQRKDGLLGITIRGGARFMLREWEVGPMQLLSGEVELLQDPAPHPLETEFEPLRELLQRILEQLPRTICEVPPRYDDAHWVGCRLAEILPLPLRVKQRMLELNDPLQRLLLLRQTLQRDGED